MIRSRIARVCTKIGCALCMSAASHATSPPEPDNASQRYGIFVDELDFQPIDPWCGTELTGFRIETPFGMLQSVPSTHRVEWINADEHPPLLSHKLEVDGLPVSRPSGLAWDGQHLWVADTGNRRILKLKLDGPNINAERIASIQHDLFRRPVGLAINPQAGELYVSDAWSDRIFVIRDGVVNREISMHGSQPGFVSGPLGIMYDSGLLYVADSRNSRIQVFRTEDGSHDSEWGLHVIRPHESNGRLHYPTDMRLSEDGSFMVVDEPWEMRQQIFRKANAEEAVAKRLPIGADDFVHYGAGVDSYDRLLAITDPDTHTLRVFDLTLDTPVLIGVIGRYGSAPHEFIHPCSVAFLPPSDDEPLRLVVADRGNARLALYTIDWSSDEQLRYRPELASLHRTVDFELLHTKESTDQQRSRIDPVALCAARDGSIAVLDGANGAIVRFNARLRPLDSIPLPVAPDGKPSIWKSIRTLPSGDLVCVNSARRLIAVVPYKHLDDQPKLKLIDISDAAVEPTDIFATQNRIWIIDRAGHRILETDRNFIPIAHIGSQGLGAGQFHHPVSISKINEDRFLVVDRGNHRIQIFDKEWVLETVAGPRLYIADAEIGERAIQTDIKSQK